MFRFLFTSWVILLSAQLSSQQQTITSKGDQNTNANMNGLVNIVVVVPPETKAALQSTAKGTLGRSSLWQGLLVPSADGVADSSCDKLRKQFSEEGPLPKSILTVRLGTNEFQCTMLPCNIVRTEQQELLAIDGKPGAITVQAKVLDKDGNIIVSIENSKFYVNPNRTYRPPAREDRSSLKVFDEAGNVVLDLRYANPHTLIVAGVFRNNGKAIFINRGEAIRRESAPERGVFSERIFGDNCEIEYGNKNFPGYYTTQFGSFLLGGSPPKSGQTADHAQ